MFSTSLKKALFLGLLLGSPVSASAMDAGEYLANLAEYAELVSPPSSPARRQALQNALTELEAMSRARLDITGRLTRNSAVRRLMPYQEQGMHWQVRVFAIRALGVLLAFPHQSEEVQVPDELVDSLQELAQATSTAERTAELRKAAQQALTRMKISGTGGKKPAAQTSNIVEFPVDGLTEILPELASLIHENREPANRKSMLEIIDSVVTKPKIAVVAKTKKNAENATTTLLDFAEDSNYIVRRLAYLALGKLWDARTRLMDPPAKVVETLRSAYAAKVTSDRAEILHTAAATALSAMQIRPVEEKKVLPAVTAVPTVSDAHDYVRYTEEWNALPEGKSGKARRTLLQSALAVVTESKRASLPVSEDGPTREQLVKRLEKLAFDGQADTKVLAVHGLGILLAYPVRRPEGLEVSAELVDRLSIYGQGDDAKLKDAAEVAAKRMVILLRKKVIAELDATHASGYLLALGELTTLTNHPSTRFQREKVLAALQAVASAERGRLPILDSEERTRGQLAETLIPFYIHKDAKVREFAVHATGLLLATQLRSADGIQVDARISDALRGFYRDPSEESLQAAARKAAQRIFSSVPTSWDKADAPENDTSPSLLVVDAPSFIDALKELATLLPDRSPARREFLMSELSRAVDADRATLKVPQTADRAKLVQDLNPFLQEGHYRLRLFAIHATGILLNASSRGDLVVEERTKELLRGYYAYDSSPRGQLYKAAAEKALRRMNVTPVDGRIRAAGLAADADILRDADAYVAKLETLAAPQTEDGANHKALLTELDTVSNAEKGRLDLNDTSAGRQALVDRLTPLLDHSDVKIQELAIQGLGLLLAVQKRDGVKVPEPARVKALAWIRDSTSVGRQTAAAKAAQRMALYVPGAVGPTAASEALVVDAPSFVAALKEVDVLLAENRSPAQREFLLQELARVTDAERASLKVPETADRASLLEDIRPYLSKGHYRVRLNAIHATGILLAVGVRGNLRVSEETKAKLRAYCVSDGSTRATEYKNAAEKALKRMHVTIVDGRVREQGPPVDEYPSPEIVVDAPSYLAALKELTELLAEGQDSARQDLLIQELSRVADLERAGLRVPMNLNRSDVVQELQSYLDHPDHRVRLYAIHGTGILLAVGVRGGFKVADEVKEKLRGFYGSDSTARGQEFSAAAEKALKRMAITPVDRRRAGSASEEEAGKIVSDAASFVDALLELGPLLAESREPARRALLQAELDAVTESGRGRLDVKPEGKSRAALVAALIPLLQDTHYRVRVYAIHGLGLLLSYQHRKADGTEVPSEVKGALRAFANSPTKSERAQLAQRASLKALGRMNLQVDVTGDLALAEELGLRSSLVDVIGRLLHTDTPNRRRAAARELFYYWDADSIQEAMLKNQAPNFVPTLIEAVSSKPIQAGSERIPNDPLVRRWVLSTLQNLMPRSGRGYRVPEWFIQSDALQAAVADGLFDDDESIREIAVDILGQRVSDARLSRGPLLRDQARRIFSMEQAPSDSVAAAIRILSVSEESPQAFRRALLPYMLSSNSRAIHIVCLRAFALDSEKLAASLRLIAQDLENQTEGDELPLVVETLRDEASAPAMLRTLMRVSSGASSRAGGDNSIPYWLARSNEVLAAVLGNLVNPDLVSRRAATALVQTRLVAASSPRGGQFLALLAPSVEAAWRFQAEADLLADFVALVEPGHISLQEHQVVFKLLQELQGEKAFSAPMRRLRTAVLEKLAECTLRVSAYSPHADTTTRNTELNFYIAALLQSGETPLEAPLRSIAAHVLGRMLAVKERKQYDGARVSEAVQFLRSRASYDVDFDVQAASTAALVRMNIAVVDQRSTSRRVLRGTTLIEVGASSSREPQPPAVSSVILEHLHSPDEAVLLAGIEELGKSEDPALPESPELAERMVSLLQHSSPKTVRATLGAIILASPARARGFSLPVAFLRSDRLFAAVARNLNHPDREIRKLANDWLGDRVSNANLSKHPVFLQALLETVSTCTENTTRREIMDVISRTSFTRGNAEVHLQLLRLMGRLQSKSGDWEEDLFELCERKLTDVTGTAMRKPAEWADLGRYGQAWSEIEREFKKLEQSTEWAISSGAMAGLSALAKLPDSISSILGRMIDVQPTVRIEGSREFASCSVEQFNDLVATWCPNTDLPCENLERILHEALSDSEPLVRQHTLEGLLHLLPGRGANGIPFWLVRGSRLLRLIARSLGDESEDIREIAGRLLARPIWVADKQTSADIAAFAGEITEPLLDDDADRALRVLQSIEGVTHRGGPNCLVPSWLAGSDSIQGALVALLGSPNTAIRETAERLIFTRIPSTKRAKGPAYIAAVIEALATGLKAPLLLELASQIGEISPELEEALARHALDGKVMENRIAGMRALTSYYAATRAQPSVAVIQRLLRVFGETRDSDPVLCKETLRVLLRIAHDIRHLGEDHVRASRDVLFTAWSHQDRVIQSGARWALHDIKGELGSLPRGEASERFDGLNPSCPKSLLAAAQESPDEVN